jgi:ribonuclease HI
MIYSLFTDGASRGNPGHASIGVAIFKDGKLIRKGSKYLGDVISNNDSEFQALIIGLKFLLSLPDYNPEALVKCHMDSSLIVGFATGKCKTKHKRMQELMLSFIPLKHKFKHIEFILIPRDRNKIADSLCNICLDKQLGLRA